jgi:uncharacterized protein (TIGR02271 family)
MKKIPVLQEELKIGKRTKETGVLLVRKKIHEREEVIDEPLLKEEVEVKRVPVNRYVEGPVPVREENGVIIVPLMEEVLVVEKRLLLKEEVHIVKKQRNVRKPRKTTVRSEEAVIEHSGE